MINLLRMPDLQDIAQKGSFTEEGYCFLRKRLLKKMMRRKVSSIYLFIVIHMIVAICDNKSFLCITFLSEHNFIFVTHKMELYYYSKICWFCVLQDYVHELFVNCSQSSRTVVNLFEKFTNNCSRTQTWDEHCSLFTNSRRTRPKSRSRRNFMVVLVFAFQEPYLIIGYEPG